MNFTVMKSIQNLIKIKPEPFAFATKLIDIVTFIETATTAIFR